MTVQIAFPSSSGRDSRGALANRWRIWRAMFIREAEAGGGPIEIAGRFVEPAVMIMAICAISWLIERHPPFGDSMIVWAVSGVAPIYLFVQISLHVDRVSEPRTPFASDMDFIIVNAFVSFLYMTFATILLLFVLYETQTHRAFPAHVVLVAIIWLLFALLAFGIGMVNRTIGVVFPSWLDIYSVVSRVIVHLSGVYYLIDALPRKISYWLWYNPLVHLITLMRWSFYGYFPHAILSVPYMCVWLGGSLVLGTILQVLVRNRIDAR